MKLISILTSFLFLFYSSCGLVRAQSDSLYVTGKVTSVISEQEMMTQDRPTYIQTLEVERTDTKEKVEVTAGSSFEPLEETQRIDVGREIILQQLSEGEQKEWVIADRANRIPVLMGVSLLFIALVIGIARIQGIFSIVGMGVSFAVLIFFILPQILSGSNPILISLLSAFVIGACSMYLSHGVSRKSHIAFVSILMTLLCVALLSSMVMSFAFMTGLGSEEAVFLQVDPDTKVNMQGLLLAGIVLGTLGILDDICISQVSIVSELIKAKPGISFKEVFSRGLTVGKDHIASLVNTLILAYAGASLPLFLLFSLYNQRPLWVTLNDEMIAEEIIRTVTGSIGLVLAVPLTTFIAAQFLVRQKKLV